MGSTNSPGSTLRVNDRDYRWPTRPVVVVCLDGSPFEYLRQAIAAGVAPYLESLVARGFVRMADAAMPTFTESQQPVDRDRRASGATRHQRQLLPRPRDRPGGHDERRVVSARRDDPASFSQAGATVVVITAKDKLRNLLGAGLVGVCLSAEQEGQPVYSALLSEHVLRRGVELMTSMTPDLMYLSTSDYVQHTHAPGSAEANRFYGVIDGHLAELDRLGATLVITADHGMQAKADAHGPAARGLRPDPAR